MHVNALEKKRAREKAMYSKVDVGQKRPCAGCGKMITNYRCPKCWEKLRRKLGLALNPEDEDEAWRIYR